jgi:signal transduction histidine kinase
MHSKINFVGIIPILLGSLLVSLKLINYSHQAEALYILQALACASAFVFLLRQRSFGWAVSAALLTMADVFYYLITYRGLIDREAESMTYISLTALPFCLCFLNVSLQTIRGYWPALRSVLRKPLIYCPLLFFIILSDKIVVGPLISSLRQPDVSVDSMAAFLSAMSTIPLIVVSLVAMLAIHNRAIYWRYFAFFAIGLTDWCIQAEYLASGSLKFSHYDYIWLYGVLMFALSVFTSESQARVDFGGIRFEIKLLLATMILVPSVTFFLLTGVPTIEMLPYHVLSSVAAFAVAGPFTEDFTRRIRRMSEALNSRSPAVSSKGSETDELIETTRIALQRIVTEEKKHLEAESQFQRELVAVASRLAHDIRSPLAALDLLSRELAAIQFPKLDLLKATITRLREISSDMLKSSKAKGSHPEPQAGTEDLWLLIEKVAQEKRYEYQETRGKTIEVHRLCPESLRSRVPASDLSRILSCLVSNSMEAFEDAPGEVQVALLKEGSRIVIRVQDNGRGISPEHLQKVGIKGFTTKSETNGNGLGIHFAKEILQRFGGSLEIRSELGRGTSVEIHLPA